MLVLQVLDGVNDNRVDLLLGVRVLAVAALSEPLEDVEALGARQGQLVAVKEVDNQGGVAIGSELVGEQLAVVPDAKDVGDKENTGVLVSLVGGGLGKVALVFASDGDLLALGGAST